MTPLITYPKIDQILTPWTNQKQLHIFTECKGEEVRVISIIDKYQGEYHLYISPDYESQDNTVIVGCDLVKRHNKKHTFYRERKNFHYREQFAITELEEALNKCLNQIRTWGEKHANKGIAPT